MSEQAETLCDLWEVEQSEAKSHSSLCHLEPIGLGGPMVESLTSYIMRLAEAHSVQPRMLVSKQILPLANLPYLYRGGRPVHEALTAFWKDSAALNGITPVAGRFMQALEQLTMRGELRYLTMLTFGGVLAYRGLMRKTRAWCPTCYGEWRDAGQVIYDPLLWTFQSVSMCPQHGQRLQVCCPNPECSHAQFHLAPRGQPGYCEWCGRWLGSASPSVVSPTGTTGGSEWSWQRWVGKAVGELLAAAPGLSEPPSRERIARTVTAYVNCTAEGSMAALSRRCHMRFETLRKWQLGATIPQLDTLLQTCVYLGASPLRWFTENAGDRNTPQGDAPSCEPPGSEISKRRLRKMDTRVLQSALEEVLQNEEDPPPTMREIGRRLGYDSSVLERYFPDLSRAISARYLDHQAKKRSVRTQRERDAIQQAVRDLSARGRYPSKDQVTKLLGYGIFREPQNIDVWRGAVRELGLR